MTVNVFPLFSVPFGEARYPDAGPLCTQLRELFLRREADGTRYRNSIRRDTQHGLFESSFDLHTWPDAPVQQVFGFIAHGHLFRVGEEGIADGAGPSGRHCHAARGVAGLRNGRSCDCE